MSAPATTTTAAAATAVQYQHIDYRMLFFYIVISAAGGLVLSNLPVKIVDFTKTLPGVYLVICLTLFASVRFRMPLPEFGVMCAMSVPFALLAHFGLKLLHMVFPDPDDHENVLLADIPASATCDAACADVPETENEFKTYFTSS